MRKFLVGKYVLTGGPCTGKTTVLQFLAGEGFQIVPEAARLIIETEQIKGGKLFPWIDTDAFQREVLRKQLEMESRIKSSVVFLDRGVPDGIAWYRLYGIDPPEELIQASKGRYDKVFLMSLLPNYKTDASRKEDPETAEMIHQFIKETYLEFDYEIIEVPHLDVSARIKFIKDNIQK